MTIKRRAWRQMIDISMVIIRRQPAGRMSDRRPFRTCNLGAMARWDGDDSVGYRVLCFGLQVMPGVRAPDATSFSSDPSYAEDSAKLIRNVTSCSDRQLRRPPGAQAERERLLP